MTQTTKKYTLGKIKQLIDLNEDSVNFELSFKVKSLDETPFYMIVVDQKTLDNSEELEYKEVVKGISGNIVADKNIYQNYFLILKADNECYVEVELNKRDLPNNSVLSSQQQMKRQSSDYVEPSQMNQQTSDYVEPLQNTNSKTAQPPPADSSGINWKTIAYVGIGIVGVLLLWYFYTRKDDSNEKDNESSVDKKALKSPDPKTYRPDMKFSSQLNNRYIKHQDSSDSSSSVPVAKMTNNFPRKYSENRRR